MDLKIKEFAKLARVESWKLQAVSEHKGWSCYYQKNDTSEPVAVTMQRGNGKRYWKSFDSLISSLTRAGFQGTLTAHISRQIDLL